MRSRPTLHLIVSLLFLYIYACGATVRAAHIASPALHAKAVAADDKISAFWPTDPVQCDLILDGEVTDGDAEELERQFNAIVGTSYAFSFFLCLRSSGGSVPEALKIAKFVLRTQRPSIATVVEDGQVCASACAFIFLAGNAPAARGAWPQRFLHPRGRLLFHSSRLDLAQVDLNRFSDEEWIKLRRSRGPDGRGLREMIADLYNDGLRDVQSVINTFQNFEYQREDIGDRWVRPSLFLEMFSQSPDEWICVDTVDAVGRWNIQVFAYQAPTAPTKRQYHNVCQNAYKWRSDEFSKDDEELDVDEINKLKINKLSKSETVPGHRSDGLFDARYSLPYQAPMAPMTCVIEIAGHDSKVGAKADVKVYLISGRETFSKLAPTSFFKAGTFLSELPGIRPPHAIPSGARSKGVFRTYPNSLMNGCSFKSFPNLAERDCLEKCSANTGCVAYSHNNLTGTCELKHTLTARRFDPTWTSGVSGDSGALEQSIRSMLMTLTSIKKGQRLDGLVLGAAKIQDDRGESELICARNCERESACVAVEFDFETEMCRKFSTVNGLNKAPDGHPVSIYLKTQH